MRRHDADPSPTPRRHHHEDAAALGRSNVGEPALALRPVGVAADPAGIEESFLGLLWTDAMVGDVTGVVLIPVEE